MPRGSNLRNWWPLYRKIILHLSPEHYSGKTFTIEARTASHSNIYIQSAKLNGRPLDRWWIRRKYLVAGGHIEIELGPTPNETWARGGPLPE